MPRRVRPRLTHLEDRAVPAVFTVTTPADAGPGSLREAIARANDEATNPGFDSVQFAPDLFGRTIALSTAADTSLGSSALLITSEVFIDGFTGYPGSGPGITLARERGVTDLRLFFVAPAGKLTLDGLTVAGGLAQGDQGAAGFSGGGGGAGLGGAVFNRGALTVTRSVFTDNQAVGGAGGAVDTGFRYGWTPGGPGGGANGGGSGTAGGFGGGGGGGGPSGQFPMPIIRLAGGAGGFGGGGGGGAPAGAGGFGGSAGAVSGGGGAGLGGAVFNHGGTVAVLNSTFANNTAFGGGTAPNAGAGLGGGVFNLNGTVTVTNSTFSGNLGGAVYVLAHDASGGVGNASPASLLLANSILANSTNGRDLVVSQLPGSGGATVTFAATNLVEAYTNTTGSVPIQWSSSDPQLLPLADNGGPTWTMGLQATSPARDAGWWVWAPTGGDQRGGGFARALGREVDLGAVEGPAIPRPLAVTPHLPTGGDATVTLLDPSTGQPLRSFVPFPGFGGAVHVSVGDVNGDGYGDLAVGAGAGGGPHVKLFDGFTGREVLSFFAYDPAFTGGVSVAAGGGRVVTGAGPGGGPHVKSFDARTGAEVLSFYAFDPAFTGGVNVAVGGGRVVTGAGPGGGPHVKAFDDRTGVELLSFFAYDPAFAGGVSVADYGRLVVGAGPGGGPHVKVFNAGTGAEVGGFYAYNPSFTGGVNVAVAGERIVTGAGPGGGPHLKTFDWAYGWDGTAYREHAIEKLSLYAFDPDFHLGVDVG